MNDGLQPLNAPLGLDEGLDEPPMPGFEAPAQVEG